MNVMILAAGEGTRLRPFTEQMPKPAIPFLSVPLAAYALSFLDQIKIDRLVVNTFYLPAQIEKLFRSLPPQWKDLIFTHEEKLLGSGGGIHNAHKYLKDQGDFFVLNGDEVILPHHPGLMQEMLSFHQWHKGIATLLTMEHPGVGSKFGGAWLNEGSKIQCFSKTTPGPALPRGLHFTGVLLFSNRIFSYFKNQIEDENILYETLTSAMASGEEVHAFECKAEWFEIGNPTDFLLATESCLNALTQKSTTTYWQEYLMQTIRLYSQTQYLVEKEWSRLSELQSTVQKIRKGNL